MRPGWAARIRNYDEFGRPHYVMVTAEDACLAELLRRCYDDAGVLCAVYRCGDEVYYQRPDGRPPKLNHVEQVELCPINSESVVKVMSFFGKTKEEILHPSWKVFQLELILLQKWPESFGMQE